MKEIICNITQQTTGRVVIVSGLDEEFTKNNVLGIINKTQSKVLYTPVQATNMLSASYQDGTITISLADNVPNINKGDELLVKLYSDKEIDFYALAKEDTLTQGISSLESKVEEVKEAVDTKAGEIIANVSQVQDKLNTTDFATQENLDTAKEEILTAVEKATPEVDLSGVAKESTLEEVKQAVDGAMGTLSNKYNEYDEAVSAQLSMLTEDDNPTAQGQVSCLRTLVGQTAGLIEQGNTLADALGKAAMAQEILKGKEELVYVINAMGGHVSIGDSFTTLAEAIENDIELLDPRIVFTDDMVYPVNLATYIAQPSLLTSRVKIFNSDALSIPNMYASKTVERIYCPNATSLYDFRGCANLIEVYCPNVTSINTFTVNSCPKVEVLNVLMSKDAGRNQNFNGATNLIDLIIGKGFESSVSFTNKGQSYNPTTAYSKATNSLCYDADLERYGQTFETNWHKWKWCIINHFAANLTDLTGLDSFTITFGSNVLAQFDEEMIAAFTNKNWTLA